MGLDESGIRMVMSWDDVRPSSGRYNMRYVHGWDFLWYNFLCVAFTGLVHILDAI